MDLTAAVEMKPEVYGNPTLKEYKGFKVGDTVLFEGVTCGKSGKVLGLDEESIWVEIYTEGVYVRKFKGKTVYPFYYNECNIRKGKASPPPPIHEDKHQHPPVKSQGHVKDNPPVKIKLAPNLFDIGAAAKEMLSNGNSQTRQ